MKVQIKKALKVFAVCFLSLKQLANGQIMYYFVQLPIMQRGRTCAHYLPLLLLVQQLGAAAILTNLMTSHCFNSIP